MERVEEQLKDLILKNVGFILDGKSIKTGKIKLFNTKQCFIKFKIEQDGDIKDWELPYPFKLRDVPNGFIFDYCLSSFCPRTEDSYWKMKLMDKSEASKMHDNYLFVVKLST